MLRKKDLEGTIGNVFRKIAEESGLNYENNHGFEDSSIFSCALEYFADEEKLTFWAEEVMKEIDIKGLNEKQLYNAVKSTLLDLMNLAEKADECKKYKVNVKDEWRYGKKEN